MEFQRAIALDPYSWNWHYDFAVLLYQTSDVPGSELRARRALELSGNHPRAHLLLGLVLLRRGCRVCDVALFDGSRHMVAGNQELAPQPQLLDLGLQIRVQGHVGWRLRRYLLQLSVSLILAG